VERWERKRWGRVRELEEGREGEREMGGGVETNPKERQEWW